MKLCSLRLRKCDDLLPSHGIAQLPFISESKTCETVAAPDATADDSRVPCESTVEMAVYDSDVDRQVANGLPSSSEESSAETDCEASCASSSGSVDTNKNGSAAESGRAKRSAAQLASARLVASRLDRDWKVKNEMIAPLSQAVNETPTEHLEEVNGLDATNVLATLASAIPSPIANSDQLQPKKRGRPKGSKNKVRFTCLRLHSWSQFTNHNG
jgi:hypothetical protein